MSYKTTIWLSLLCLMIFSCNPTAQRGSQFKKWIHGNKKQSGPLKAPANMVYIPAGSFVMGETESGTTAERYTYPQIKEVEAFYIDRTEVTNLAYVVYLNWLRKNADELEYYFALPDTQCWYDPFSYNEPLVRNYLRHPTYKYYPVVGVSWVQATKYCEWRTERINELDSNSDPIEVRLPTEMEWEFAAIANYNYNEITKTNYNTFSIRRKHGNGRGLFNQNFQRGKGDAKGISNRPNDAAFIPAPVYMYEPNEYGLYNIYGNVSEWVADVYLPVTLEDITVPINESDSMYNNDSLKKDVSFVDPEDAFLKILDSLGVGNLSKGNEVITDINNNILRVYKGGSWRDRAYYLQPGTRRYLPQTSATALVGFRCASSVDPKNVAASRGDVMDSLGRINDSVALADTSSDEKGKKAKKIKEDKPAKDSSGVKAEKAPKVKLTAEEKAAQKEKEKLKKEKEKEKAAKEKEKAKKEKEKAKAAKAKPKKEDEETDE